MKKYFWHELSGIDSKLNSDPGVYAWYYRPCLSIRDISYTYERLEGADCIQKKIAIVERFLDKYLFKFFKEDAYFVEVFGPLKPRYGGSIEHVDQFSSSLVEKIIDGSICLYQIRLVLEKLNEAFLSPIYIGMSSNLGRRISQHRALINARMESQARLNSFVDGEEDIERDRCFADRVAKRGYVTSSLFVVLQSTQNYNPIENLLNRINYPILGRN